jgi:hypothetical protein
MKSKLVGWGVSILFIVAVIMVVNRVSALKKVVYGSAT